jgi:hypothetical protein
LERDFGLLLVRLLLTDRVLLVLKKLCPITEIVQHVSACLLSDVYCFGLLVYRIAGLTDGTPSADRAEVQSSVDPDILDLCRRCTGPIETRPTADALIHVRFSETN